MRLGGASNLEALTVQGYEASVAAALGNITANVTVVTWLYFVLLQYSFQALTWFVTSCG